MRGESKQAFKKCLESKKLRMTAQRTAIFEAFYKQGGHISAEDLYRNLKSRKQTAGAATVYRTLKILTQCGLAREVRFRDGVSMFEPDFKQLHHDHLVCTSCGKTVEFLNSTIERLQSSIAKKHGYVITSHRMDVFGLCRACRPKAG